MRYSVNCPRSDLAVSPVSVGWSANPDVTRFGPAKRDQYIIHFVVKGEGSFLGNRAVAGQGFLITPGLLEEYHANKDNPWTFLWTICYGDDMEKLFRLFKANDNRIFDFDHPEKLEPILEYIAKDHGKILSLPEMQMLFYRILGYCLKSCESKSRSADRRKSSQVYLDYAVEMIGRDYSRGITVSEICRRLGVSEPYLYRLFKEKFGKSPKQYINALRVEQSKMLLSETSLSITEIGAAVGYEDVLDFSKFFSRMTGKSPVKFRCEALRSEP